MKCFPSSVCKVSLKDAHSAIGVIRKYRDWTAQLPKDENNFISLPGVSTAWSLLQNLGVESDDKASSQLCLPVGVVTMCKSIQICLTVQLPKWFGGLAGQAIFIDTEGNFVPCRAQQMAEALVAHCRKHVTFEDGHEPTEEERERFSPTVESLMSGIHYIRIADHVQLMATVQRLEQFCSKQANVSI
ncbi:unnamed protein product [Echinostoma caproni]|uniref:Rad51 domain-containing protein n=1 Tax=Echinostoma caproni TaxID=27848 RepID=A0A183A864_9TREM|nr:unnamed protein product [Echinostoma caproni]